MTKRVGKLEMTVGGIELVWGFNGVFGEFVFGTDDFSGW